MSKWERVKQWNTMIQVWHLFDARWQNPFLSADLLVPYLEGSYKPIHHALARVGDHVVVINTKEIALPGQEWRWRAYYHHTLYKKGASYTRAWELHDKDPTLVMKKAIYKAMRKSLQRHSNMRHLHLFPDDKVPDEILENVSNQIRPLRTVPRSLDTYTKEEIESFPKVYDFPEQHVIR